LANYSLFVGRPLAGARVVDIRCAIDFLASRREVEASRIAVAGRGAGALSTVLAATFDERISCIMADELLASWVFNEEFVDIGLVYMIPRILTVTDMPQLLAHVAPRPLIVTNPVDGRHRPLSPDDAKQKLRYTSAIYGVEGAGDRLQIANADAEATANNLAARLNVQE
jgi:hypothetical protein